MFIITGILQTTPAKPCVSLWCWLIGTGEEKHANAKELETISKLFGSFKTYMEQGDEIHNYQKL